MDDLGELKKVVDRLDDRLAKIENVLDNGLTCDIESTKEMAQELKRLVQGDPGLKVPSLRDVVSSLTDEINKIKTSMDRAKWFMIGSGAANLGSAAVFISQIFGAVQ